MTNNSSAFTKKHEEVMAADKKAILEELNLPPAVITFLRKHAKTIKIVLVVIAVAVIVWEGYGEYNLRQQEKSSSLLFTAVNAKNEGEQKELLQNLIQKFSSSKSAAWANIELGHIAFQEKNYREAINKYQEVIQNLSTDSSLYPLVQFSLAQASDSIGDTDKSESAYQALLQYNGFAAQGYLGLGRLYEKKGDVKKALEMYESYINLPDLEDSVAKEMVENKISTLKDNK
jgi:predicted negative regulator of RcsB-dependent stress response